MTENPDDSSATRNLIEKRDPSLPQTQATALAAIWDQVVDRLVKAMLELEDGVERELHINVKAEMTFEVARLSQFFADSVVKKRASGRDLATIDPIVEREECLGPAGEATIRNTAKMAHEHIWDRLMKERWEPKSRKALEREKTPRPAGTLAVKAVRDKHFISRWFIRDHWADGPKVSRWRRSDVGLERKDVLFATWGHSVGLWDDRTEAYFSLLENDGKRPIEMLLATIPLNPPQQQAFVAYLVIHMLRSPWFVLGLRTQLKDMLHKAAKNAGVAFEDMARGTYTSLIQQHDLYDAYARPLLWSRWAIVTAEQPVFVLPDTFCRRGAVGDEHRVIVPLTPTKCFVALPSKEEEKRVVPFHIAADAGLARQISNLLIASAELDFLAHRGFVPDEFAEPASFAGVLGTLEGLVANRN